MRLEIVLCNSLLSNVCPQLKELLGSALIPLEKPGRLRIFTVFMFVKYNSVWLFRKCLSFLKSEATYLRGKKKNKRQGEEVDES